MVIITLLLLIFALVCFLIGAFGQHAVSRINMIALGLAFWVTTAIIATAQTIG
jgi:hypothetical protein